MNKTFAKPTDFDQLYPGRFLKSGELLGKKVTVKIADVAIDELEGEKGKRIQGIIFIEGKGKQIVLNKTNGLCLRGMFGRKLSNWIGKRITIFQDKTKLAGEIVDCIRIWGSPDISEDRSITINLPRKKPFTMTMHKIAAPGAGFGPAPAVVPPSEIDAQVKRLREQESVDDLDAAWGDISSRYAQTDTEIPLDVEAACNERREQLDIPY